jgi:hypothetical protein
VITRIRKAKARSTANTVVYHTRETQKSVRRGVKLADHVGKRIIMLKYVLAEATVIVDKHIP